MTALQPRYSYHKRPL